MLVSDMCVCVCVLKGHAAGLFTRSNVKTKRHDGCGRGCAFAQGVLRAAAGQAGVGAGEVLLQLEGTDL